MTCKMTNAARALIRIGINCGVVYVQNASPRGPVGWLGYEVARRTLAWLDDSSALLAANPLFAGNLTWVEESVLFEQVHSTLPFVDCSGLNFFLTQFGWCSKGRNRHQ